MISPSDGAGAWRDRPALSVVMPVYNERNFIEEILWRVQAVAIDKEIIIVDDGSGDGTREFLADLVRAKSGSAATVPLPSTGRHLRVDNLTVVFQDAHRGKGAALRQGLPRARGDVVIIQDADLEYDPQDYPALVRPITTGEADVVYGSRFAQGRPDGTLLRNYLGNRLITVVANLATGQRVADAWVCYKTFRRTLLESLVLEEDGFGFELEVTVKVARAGWRVRQVPVSYRARGVREGKKITWRDGLAGLWCIAKYTLRPGAGGPGWPAVARAAAVACLLTINLLYYRHLLSTYRDFIQSVLVR